MEESRLNTKNVIIDINVIVSAFVMIILSILPLLKLYLQVSDTLIATSFLLLHYLQIQV